MRQSTSPATAELIHQRVAQGWTLRRIARSLRLNRKTLRRVLYEPPPPPRCPIRRPPEITDDPFHALRQTARRCAGCGGLVFQWPCLTCRLRGSAERRAA